MKTITKNDVEFSISIEPEFTPIEKALSFKETGADHSEYIQKVLDDRWNNPWLWCIVKVSAKLKNLEGVAYLGQCAYGNEQEFKDGGYYEQMCDEAFEELSAQIKELQEVLC